MLLKLGSRCGELGGFRSILKQAEKNSVDKSSLSPRAELSSGLRGCYTDVFSGPSAAPCLSFPTCRGKGSSRAQNESPALAALLNQLCCSVVLRARREKLLGVIVGCLWSTGNVLLIWRKVGWPAAAFCPNLQQTKALGDTEMAKFYPGGTMLPLIHCKRVGGKAFFLLEKKGKQHLRE